MVTYRARDALLPPTLISFLRLPLAVAFPFAVTWPLAGTVILLVAGVSDVVDGWWARRANMVTAIGTVVDPITDKLFVMTVVVSLIVHHKLDVASVVWMSTREIGELPLVLWLVASERARQTRKEKPTALPLGKAATCIQFATVVAAMWGLSVTPLLVWITAGLGALAALGYWHRMLRTRVPR